MTQEDWRIGTDPPRRIFHGCTEVFVEGEPCRKRRGSLRCGEPDSGGAGLLLSRPFDGFGRERGLRLAIGGFPGESKFPQPYRVLRNEGVSRGELRHGRSSFRRRALTLFLSQLLARTRVIRVLVQNVSFEAAAPLE